MSDIERLNIYSSAIDGGQALCFDTGLDSRAFAQARLAQFLSEHGCIVNLSGGIVPWKAGGVVEAVNPSLAQGAATMHIWGQAFAGERLDRVLHDSARRDAALAAVVSWIDARLALEGEENVPRVPLWPCAALIANAEPEQNTASGEAVLFLPENIVRRCIQAEGEEARLRGIGQYVHPDLEGADAAAFTAAAMLYRVFSGAGAFSALREDLLHQDMREGNFLPLRLAAPGLDPQIAELIQEALTPQGKSTGAADCPSPQGSKSDAADLLAPLRESLGNANPDWKAEKFFHALGGQELEKLAEEKEKYLHRKKIQVNARRFVIRNTAIIAGIAAAVLITLFVGASIAKGRASAPTTAGMDSLTVVNSYYEAINSLDHQFLEASTARGAGKADITMTANLFVINRVRQAYEYSQFKFMPPDEWLEAGRPPLDIPVYGISGLHITHVSGSEDSDAVHYSAVYALWLPISENDDNEPLVYNYTDELRLERIKGNWRIAEIKRSGDIP